MLYSSLGDLDFSYWIPLPLELWLNQGGWICQDHSLSWGANLRVQTKEEERWSQHDGQYVYWYTKFKLCSLILSFLTGITVLGNLKLSQSWYNCLFHITSECSHCPNISISMFWSHVKSHCRPCPAGEVVYFVLYLYLTFKFNLHFGFGCR